MLVFDIRSDIAHFKRPDTIGTHVSYPFIPRTALHGLVASILGLDALPETPLCGIRLLSPVISVAQELSLLGKGWVGSGSDFNRPTAIELVIKPHYRIYFQGPLEDELGELLKQRRAHYHTYMGSAFCLTFPEFQGQHKNLFTSVQPNQPVTCISVVPAEAIQDLQHQEGCEYARIGGMLYEHIGNRQFRGSINLIYEVNGQPIIFTPSSVPEERWQFSNVPDEGLVCLW